MKILYLKGYKWLLSQNQQKRKTFLVIEDTRHWLSVPNFFKKNIKVKGRQCPDYYLIQPISRLKM